VCTPAGELYYAAPFTCSGSLKLVNNNTTPQQALPYGIGVEGPAFDRDGYLYLINGFYLVNGENSKVVLFDPSFKQARGRSRPTSGTTLYRNQLVFWRDAAGNMTDRLFAIRGGHHRR
jgi:hypothetical protein